ncbi:MAG: MoxR family ATPase [Clostridia bacterium]|nr:MoxR family ATPase [Clostridia bacterium]MBQ2348957.1 MoxR family ATPase [Clostridia bacterium]
MDKQIEKLVDNISSVIIGKQQAIINVIAAMLSEGHILIEDVPGVGKTRLISSLASSVDGDYNRIQLTPDIMPSDIVGFSMINPQTRQLEYKTGAAMCNFLLADEINRASPKSQSSLLEVMEERQISLDGKTMPLPLPFMVLATQNPVETYGTYHLPEAQMDRFLMKISMGYPAVEDELDILTRSETKSFAQKPQAVMNTEDVKKHIEKVKAVTCRDNVKAYIVDLLNATRSSQLVKLGASPRAGIALLRASKAIAYINGRDYVTPDDVKTMTLPVLSHRLMLSPKGKSAYPSSEAVMSEIASSVNVPLQ